ncbi:MAG: alpha/beta hydrolase-fold protein [Bacteroidota bacterium]
MKKLYSLFFWIICLFFIVACFDEHNIKNHKGETINISQREKHESYHRKNVGEEVPDDRFTRDQILSEILGYDVQFWVQTPKDYAGNENYPTLYVTDGQGYKKEGRLADIADELIAEEKINPVIIIYVDPRDPNDLSNNRRNAQFLCNPAYVEFYKEELIPYIDRNYRTDASQKTRGILGLSFGGLNAMYFGIHAHDVFGKVGIQSPAPHPCPDIYDEYAYRERLPIDVFLSTGTKKDKETATRKFKKILKRKGYDFGYMELPEGHNWKNWTPQLDDVLLRFYGK